MEKTKEELDKIITKEYLVEKYLNKEIPAYKIEKELSIGGGRLKPYLEKFNIPQRGICKTTEEFDNILNEKFLLENYVGKEISEYGIAKMVPCDTSTVRNRLIRYNIKIRTNRKKIANLEQILTREFLEEKYVKEGLTTYQVAEIVGCDYSTVIVYLRKFGIYIRNKSEAFRGSKVWIGKHSGENNHFWKGGISSLQSILRDGRKGNEWRKGVFQRDNWTCQECSKQGYVEAHHIKEFSKIFAEFLQKYPQFSPIEEKEILVRLSLTYEPFWDINNGKTLCRQHHDLTYKQATDKKGEKKCVVRLNGLIVKRVNKIALLKSGELLENQGTDNQQPSLFKKEGSETRDENPHEPQTVVETAEDIVRTANI